MSNEEFLKSISLDGEIWKDVVGYEGLYVVSNYSRVASLPRYRASGRIMKLSMSSWGYYCLCLRKNNTSRKEYLHRIVAQAWIPNPNNYPQVDHIDGCRTNSSIDNLRWCTLSMNQNYMPARIRKSIAKKQDKSKSSEVVCLKENEVLKVYSHLSSVADDNHHISSVWKCLVGIKKHHHGLSWKYLSDCPNLNINDVKELLDKGGE